MGVVVLLSPSVGVQARPRVEELVLQGNRLCERGKYQRAIAIYQRALKEYDSPDAAYNLGVTYEINLRDMKQAIYFYQYFLSLEPNSDDARQVWSWIKEIRTAYPSITPQKAKSLEELPPKLRQKVISDLAQAQDLYRQGKHRDAVKGYREVLQIYDSADACYNLGLIYDKKLNQKHKAIEYYQRFLLLDPRSPDVERVRQWIEQARKILQQKNKSP